jgi:hypothetical protein
MGINKVDQYVKGMFADEAIQPPKGAENALFERMDKIRSRKRQARIFGSVALVCFAYWGSATLFENPEVAFSNSEQVEANPADLSVLDADELANEMPVIANEEPMESNQSEAIPSVEAPSDLRLAAPNAMTNAQPAEVQQGDRKGALEPIDVLPASPASHAMSDKALREAEEERWVMPAVVKVKD